MKILVAIANYGINNDQYLGRLLDEYRTMRDDISIVVTSNVKKNLGQDVEVAVGLPSKNPLSLPFAHKRIFADRLEFYDLFIYSEDDILITQRNVDAFLRMADVLPKNEIAGFLRFETDATGGYCFPDVHTQYHWDAGSVCYRGDHSFAFFTNQHSGCYALTKDQLRMAISSGAYLVTPHEGKWGMLEAAATDPYTQCGFRKMLCISNLDDFLVPHLSNKYVGHLGLDGAQFRQQVRALLNLSSNGKCPSTLFPVETRIYHQHWSKSYYEPCQSEMISLVPNSARRVLSIGCGWGATESQLVEKGMQVKAVPLDRVIAANARAKGVEIVHGSARAAREKLGNERFDCILMSNALHLVKDPAAFLSIFSDLLASGGTVIASVPNLTVFRRFSRRIRLHGHFANPKSYDASGMHVSTGRLLRRWFDKAGLKPQKIVYEVSKHEKRSDQLSFGCAKPFVGSTAYVVGIKADKHSG